MPLAELRRFHACDDSDIIALRKLPIALPLPPRHADMIFFERRRFRQLFRCSFAAAAAEVHACDDIFRLEL